MKVSQLTEFKMKNFFLEKSHTKCVKKTIPRPFLNHYWTYLWKVLYSLFLLYAKLKAMEVY